MFLWDWTVLKATFYEDLYEFAEYLTEQNIFENYFVEGEIEHNLSLQDKFSGRYADCWDSWMQGTLIYFA